MNKSICNFLLFIILLVLAVLFFGCEKRKWIRVNSEDTTMYNNTVTPPQSPTLKRMMEVEEDLKWCRSNIRSVEKHLQTDVAKDSYMATTVLTDVLKSFKEDERKLTKEADSLLILIRLHQ